MKLNFWGWSKTCQHFTVGDTKNAIHRDWSQTRLKALGELLEHQGVLALLNLSPQSSDLSFFQGDTVCRLRWVRYSKYHKKLTVTFLALKNAGQFDNPLCVPFVLLTAVRLALMLHVWAKAENLRYPTLFFGLDFICALTLCPPHQKAKTRV